MPNVIMHFEIPADDVDRAKTFYEETFGWTITPYPMPPGQEYFGVTAMDGDKGINGGLMQRKMPGQPFTNYVTVESIDELLPLVEAKGGRVALPKQEIGQGMGWIAAFLDPESNLIGLHQVGANAHAPAPKPAAKAKSAPRKKVRPAARKAATKRTAATKRPAKKAAKKRR